MDDSEKSILAYDKLYSNMPSIGCLSRKKRILAYFKIAEMTQVMIDEGEISEDYALFILSILARKCSSFQKAAMMVALNLNTIDKKRLFPIGFKYANEYRCSLQMLPVDDENDR